MVMDEYYYKNEESNLNDRKTACQDE